MPKMPVRVERIRATAVELGLYLPVGVYSKARDQLTGLTRRRIEQAFTDLIDRGHERVQPIERRMRRGASLVEDEVGQGVSSAATSARQMGRAARGSASKATLKNVKKASAAVASQAPKSPGVAAPRTAKDLPLEDYDSLNVSEITSKLSGLTQTELAKVYKYEQAHDNRRTVLDAIDAKLIELPLPTYDALTAEEIVARLENLSQDELKLIRRYESGTKSRTTVLEKIDALVA